MDDDDDRVSLADAYSALLYCVFVPLLLLFIPLAAPPTYCELCIAVLLLNDMVVLLGAGVKRSRERVADDRLPAPAAPAPMTETVAAVADAEGFGASGGGE